MKEQDLQYVYNQNLLEWESLLNEIAQKISNELKHAEFKFTQKKRVKSIESLNAKRQNLREKRKRRNSKIKDLLGLRIIVPFLEDVEHVTEIVKNLFEVVDIEKKSEALSYREFDYDSVHLEVALPEKRSFILPDFCENSCEIQVRTILQDAWAEVEHELIYKSSVEFPDNQSIRKKMAALNANLSLSDMIFQEIRDKQKELMSWGRQRFQEIQKAARVIPVEPLPEVYKIPSVHNYTSSNIEKVLLKALGAHNEENYHTAIELYTRALDTHPALKIRAILYNHRGLAYFMIQQEKKALIDLDKSIHCDPKYYRALNNRAMFLRRKGLTNEALYNLNKSLELNNKQFQVYYLRAQTLFEIDEFDKALLDIEKALQLSPDHSDALGLLEKIKSQM